MSSVLHRDLHQNYPVAVKGEGVYIIDKSGNRYLDGACGASITCMGFDNQTIIRAIKAQLDTIPFAYTTGFTTEPLERLGEYMVRNAPDGLDYAYFVSSGSEAVEAAIMLARQYAVEKGEPKRRHLIARRNSYHGTTLASLAAGCSKVRRAPYGPLLMAVSHIAPCYPYRGCNEGETEEDYGRRVADELETEILRLGADSVFGFIAETVVGGNSGAVAPVPGYFRRVREICDQYGVLLILDEVMCGLGRTGSYYAFEQEGIQADIVTVAKGLSAGYQPIGGVLFGAPVYDAIKSGTGGFKHGHSFLGHATCCAGALATQKLLLEGGVLENVKRQSAALEAGLLERFGAHPQVGEIRGRGLFRGLELVRDRATKVPFAVKENLSGRIRESAMQHGLYIYAQSGCIDGVTGDFVLIAPPFVINDDDLESLISRLGEAVDFVIADIFNSAKNNRGSYL